MDDVTAARIMIRLLDLTSLNDNDTEYSIEELCRKARTPYGNTAAVCVYPKFVSLAKRLLSDSDIKVATVVNFPAGEYNLKNLKKEICTALEYGANEIDAVFPYRKFLENDIRSCTDFVKAAYELCDGKTLKIILETGEIKNALKISEATMLCIDNGADFIKTSTGKTKISATPEAANIILETIKNSGQSVGFKASGGIKTTSDAKQYLTLAETIMGYKWISPQNIRLGASSLLNSLIKTINQGF